DEGAKGLHADVDGRVHDPEQPRRHPQRRDVGHCHERSRGEQRADQKVGATPAQAVPCVVAHVTDDGLDHQPRQRCREPENRNLVRLCAEVLVDGAHVRHLQSPAELDAQEAEAHVPDLPEAHLTRYARPSWGPRVRGNRPAPSTLPVIFSSTMSPTSAPARALLMTTVSRTGERAKLRAVTWTPLASGSRWTMTTRPRAFTVGTSICSLSLMRYAERAFSIFFSSQENEPGRSNCSASVP